MDRNPGASGAWHSLAPEEVLAALGGRARGLTSTEAAQRLLRYGRNALPAAPRPGPLARFLRQFHSVLIYVLLAAAIITAGLGHLTDAAVILGVVLVNAVIGFVQEGKAEAALEAVRAMLPGTATVLRDNERRSIAAADLVPGDVVLLEAGERVPADLRLLHAKNLRVQEAALTGESAPSDKSVEPAAAEAPLAERGSMAYSGTVTSSGLATGVVCATGANTESMLRAAAWRGNDLAFGVTLILVLLQLAFTYLPWMNAVFHSAPIDAAAWALIIGCGAALFLLVEIEKALLHPRERFDGALADRA
jgi:magnesium-transporting ATPase (P-type)